MANLSIRVPDSLLADLEKWSKGRSKSEVIREALELYRREQSVREKRSRLTRASQRVRANSMAVNREFAEIEQDIDEA